MNDIQSAVTDVALSGNTTRARRAPATPAASPSAAADVKPGRGRGRQPVFLKGGKPLKEARDEAKAAVAAAKQVLKDAKATKAATAKADKDAKRGVVSAEAELGRVTGKPLPNKADQKVALTNAKAGVKVAKDAAKVTAKADSDADKALAKAQAVVGKAEEARLKVETLHVAAKHPAAPAPTVN